MKMKSTFRRPLLAILLVFATAALGLQPLVFDLESGCSCDAMVTSDLSESAANSSCCSSSAEGQETAGCCSSKPVTKNKCCCNPQVLACECGDCGCGEGNDSKSSLPAIPTTETTEVITPTLICAAPFVGFPRESEVKRVGYSIDVAEHAALSSQQTCVLLSRFTC